MTGLRRNDRELLSLRDLIVLSVAFMTPIIPAFLYFNEAAVITGVAATSSLFALIAILITANNFSRLFQSFPSSGSVFTFANNGIHPYAGFIAGWNSILFYILAPVCAIMVSAQVIKSAIPIIPSFIFIILLAVGTSIANYFGAKQTAKICFGVFLVAFALVIIYILVCFISAGKGMGTGKILSFQPFFESNVGLLKTLSTSALICLAFLGFESSSLYTGDAINSKENVGKAVLISCIIIGGILFIQSYASELVVLHDGNTLFSFENIVKKTGGSPMIVIYSFAIIISGILVGIAGQSAANRIISFMGKHNALPHALFARKQLDDRMPPLNMIFILVVVLVVSLIPVSLTTLEQLMIFAGAFILLTINVTALVYFYFKKNENSIVNALVLPGIGALYSLYMIINVGPKYLLIGVIWLVIGAIIVLAKHILNIDPVDTRTDEERESSQNYSNNYSSDRYNDRNNYYNDNYSEDRIPEGNNYYNDDYSDGWSPEANRFEKDYPENNYPENNYHENDYPYTQDSSQQRSNSNDRDYYPHRVTEERNYDDSRNTGWQSDTNRFNDTRATGRQSDTNRFNDTRTTGWQDDNPLNKMSAEPSYTGSTPSGMTAAERLAERRRAREKATQEGPEYDS